MRRIKTSDIVLVLIGMVLVSLFVITQKEKSDQVIPWTNADGILETQVEKRTTWAKQKAMLEGRPVFIYFHADWCATCPAVENGLLREKIIVESISQITAMKIDVSDYAPVAKFLEREYSVMAMPAISFIDASGEIRKETTLVGEHIPRELLVDIARKLGMKAKHDLER